MVSDSDFQPTCKRRGSLAPMKQIQFSRTLPPVGSPRGKYLGEDHVSLTGGVEPRCALVVTALVAVVFRGPKLQEPSTLGQVVAHHDVIRTTLGQQPLGVVAGETRELVAGNQRIGDVEQEDGIRARCEITDSAGHPVIMTTGDYPEDRNDRGSTRNQAKEESP